jgi:HK97 gp10 family phage protein
VITLNEAKLQREIADLAKSYQDLPKHIAKKHMVAAMRRSVMKSKGVSILRQNTPPAGTRRGRRKKGEKARSTGEMRRSVTTKAKWIGNNKSGAAVAGLGYKYGRASQKAIWHEFGTTRMKGIGMMQRTFEQIRGKVASLLAGELAAALEKAAAEKAGGKNKGYGG